MMRRRLFLAGSAALLAGCAYSKPAAPAVSWHDLPDDAGLARIRSSLGEGARLGISALDTGSGRKLSLDATSRYAMCSTFKAALAGAILERVDAGTLSLEEQIEFGRDDLVEYAPVVGANLGEGRLSFETLCAAIVEVSDNAAANLLLAQIGGPGALTEFFRRCGDKVTRLDRLELDLNSNIPGDPRDTTTPAAMLGLMRVLLLGHVLKPQSRARLIGWMERSDRGLNRLRAGFPKGWRAGDKTGAGNGANNDIAIAWPRGRAPILIASYIDARNASNDARNAAHAAVGRLVSERFG
jgi:beta-lactamase class A